MKVNSQKIVFLYVIVSLAWILLSDYLVEIVGFITGANSHILQTAKGFFFICVTASLLYLALRKHQKVFINYGEQYKRLFHSHPNPLWIYDYDTLRFLEVNNAAINVYGYSLEEFRSMTIMDIRPAEDIPKTYESVRRMPEFKHISENWRHLKKDGEVLTVSITSNKIKFDNRECALVMALDVTAQLEQEELLKLSYSVEKELKEELERNLELVQQSLESKQRLAEVVDRINNMVVITDPAGRIIWVNQAFVLFTGYSFDEVKGQSYDFLHSTDTGKKPGTQPIESIKKTDFASLEIINYTKCGQEYWVELSISAIHNDNNELVRYICIHNIITERKQREERIRLQNRILRKHSWTNSHAIRKPLANILSLLQLSTETEQIEELKEIHSLIKTCSEELDSIIKDVGKEINNYEKEDI